MSRDSPPLTTTRKSSAKQPPLKFYLLISINNLLIKDIQNPEDKIPRVIWGVSSLSNMAISNRLVTQIIYTHKVCARKKLVARKFA